MRLDKFVSHALNISRAQSKKLIQSGKISVSSKTQTDVKHQLLTEHQVAYSGKLLDIPGPTYIALNKPAGYVCSTVDETYPSALNLLQHQNINGLHFAGRLDHDTTGLVIISDDGQWTHRVTSPRKKQPKTYLVKLAEAVTEEAVSLLESGVQLKNESAKTLPAKVAVVEPALIRLTICEGKYHQVKRMFAAVGNHVVSLHRESIGEINLNGLAVSDWRELSPAEIAAFN